MTSNDTFQACDFTGAEQITEGGDLQSGAKYIDVVFEQDSIDKQYYFASQTGCEQGQKIAVVVIEQYETEYDKAYKAGQESGRIQHCDCDHSIYASPFASEVYHTGYTDGCKSEMPDDRSCCPGDDVECPAGRYGCRSYKNGGNCIRKSDTQMMMGLARDVYMKCNGNDECDQYKAGACPYWRVYNYGGYVYNSMEDGLEGCACTEDSEEPHCNGYLVHRNCATCASFLRYNRRGNRMPDIPANYACDGANSTFNEVCDMWYLISHCADLKSGKELGAGFTGDTLAMIQKEITEETCDMSLHVAAYKMYEDYSPSKFEADFGMSKYAEETTTSEPEVSFTALAAVGLMIASIA
jgi:hypothetical protein